MGDVQERNAKAVMQALNNQNNKLQEFQDKLLALSIQVKMMQESLEDLKRRSMDDLVAKFGNGPTVQ